MARHNVLLDHIQKLGETVAARSGMTVDPSPETAVLIQIATRNVPGALIASGNVRWYAGRATIKGYLGGDDRMAIQLYHENFTEHFDAAASDLDRASEDAKTRVRPEGGSRPQRVLGLLRHGEGKDPRRPEDGNHAGGCEYAPRAMSARR